MTDAERRLWRGLREAFPDQHWRSQVPFGVNYTVDFCSHRAHLIIEVDGGQHDERRDCDAGRTKFLNSQGYQLVRFWNPDVLQNLHGVLEVIAQHLASPLVGEVGGGRRASARHETLHTATNDAPGPQTRAAPTQPSPQGGGLK